MAQEKFLSRLLSFTVLFLTLSLASAHAAMSVSCTLPSSAQAGVAYTGASCTAIGGTSPYSYSISVGALPANLMLAPTTGAISGTPTTAGTYSFTVSATDSAATPATATFAVTSFVVLPATLTLNCTFPTTAQANVAYTGASCTAAGGATPYTYSLVGAPTWMSISATTGAISGTPPAAATISFSVKVTDSEATPQSQTYAVTNFVVTPAALTLNCIFPATAQVNVAYTGASCSAGGGTTPYTYSLVGAPTWMSISATTGAISGTPTAATTTSFSVKVTDSESTPQSKTFAVTSFVVAPATLTLSCTFPATAQANAPYTGASCSAGGGTAPYTYSLVGAPAWMSISATTGAISGTPTTATTTSFSVKVTDSESTPQSQTYAVTSFVVAPATLTLTCTFPATAQVNMAYTGASCTAGGGTTPYTYSLVSAPTWMSISATTGAISGTPTAATTTSFSVKVTDSESTPQSQTYAVTSFVVVPATLTLSCTFPATAQVNAPYTGASCTAAGGTNPYTYSLVSAPTWMSISATTGAISGTPTAATTTSFSVKVTDSESTPQSQTYAVTSFVVAPATLTLTCTFPATAQVNMAYTGASCTAGGGTTPYTYSLVSAPAWMSISAAGVISGTPTASGTFSFTAKVMDSASQIATYAVTSFVVAPATLTLSCTFPATAQANAPYTGASCSAGGGTAPYTYSLVGAPAWMSISATTGAISGTPTTATTTSFSVKVTDSESTPQSQTYAVTSFVVAPATLTLTCTFPATAQVNMAYTGASCTAGGGTTPYTYSLVSAPAWMSISAAGVISGTPTASGTFSFTAKVMDSASQIATYAVTSFVVAPATLTLSCTFPATAQVNASYTGASCSAGGGTTPYTYSLVGAPTWMSISATTGAISGTPTAATTTSFSVKVTDSESTPQSQTYAVTSFVVAPATLTLTCTFPATAQVNMAYTGASCTAGGGTTPYTYSLVSAPAWMSISAAGVISGTPTASGTFSFTAKVMDSASQIATYAVTSFVVAPAVLTLNCTFPATAQVNVAYTGASCTAAGGTTPYTYSLVGAPAWMSISATGVISGTPTAATTTSFSVKVMDSASTPQTTTYAVTNFIVAPATLTLNCTFPATAEIGVAYTGASCTAAGGTTPYTYSLVGAPAWMSISATGVISGTPTTATTTSFSVKVTDSASTPQTATYKVTSFVVAPATLTLSCNIPTTAQVNAPYTGASCSAAGGTTPYAYSLVGAPSWMSVNANGAIAGTPTSTGSYNFSIKVTDAGSPIPQTASQQVTLTVNLATLTLSCTFPATAQVNMAYTGASCTAGGGTTPYTYSLVSAPAWMSISAAGVSSGTPTASGTFSFTAKVMDSASQTATYAVTSFVVAPAVLTLNCTFPATAQVNVAYTGASCTAAGGTTPYTYSLVGAPAWMSISATGVISGTPTAATTTSFSVKVTDAGSQTATYNLTSFVVAPPTLTLSCNIPTTAQVNAPYTGASCSAAGGTTPYAYSLVGAPSWMSVNANGAIAGTPTSTGSYNFSIKVTDAGSPTPQTASQQVTLTVNLATLTLSCTFPATAQVNLPYGGASCTAGGGTTPYTYSLVSAPTWMSISATTGAISGTPITAATISFSVKVTDSEPTPQTASFAVTAFTVAPASAPAVPTFTFSGFPSTQTPGSSITGESVGLTTSSAAWPVTITLTFSPNPSAVGVSSTYIDPALGFTPTSGTTQSYSLTIPALTTSASLPNIAPGTVAGTVNATLTVVGETGATASFVVPASVPIITPGSVQILGISSSGFDVEVIGNSSTRDLRTAIFTFNAAANTSISGTNTFSVDVSSLMKTWYSGTTSQQYGSQFLLTVPFTYSGSSSAIGSVSVTLVNSVGTSTSVTGTP